MIRRFEIAGLNSEQISQLLECVGTVNAGQVLGFPKQSLRLLNATRKSGENWMIEVTTSHVHRTFLGHAHSIYPVERWYCIEANTVAELPPPESS